MTSMLLRTTLLLGTVGLLAACGASPAPQEGAEAPARSARIDVTGAGATFVFPLLSKWSTDYAAATGHRINYQSIGSGGGIAQAKAGTVDFGSTDAPLAPEELAAANLGQFPSVVGGVVPVVNLEGVADGQLRLTGELVADIYLGRIQRWNDPAIVEINPGVSLPDTSIRVVYRSDGSGTTFNFVNYLSQVSPAWLETVGQPGTAVKWPTGVGGKGNEGVAAYTKQLPGAIGYVELSYALQNNMTTVSLGTPPATGCGRTSRASRPPPPAPTGRMPRTSISSSPMPRARPPGRSPPPTSSCSRRRRATRPAPAPCSTSSAGAMPRAMPGPRNSAMCRCRPSWWPRSRPTGARTSVSDPRYNTRFALPGAAPAPPAGPAPLVFDRSRR
jgi:ABC-type phosphate transport system substrate-binding protein